jgi:hypothetical protein
MFSRANRASEINRIAKRSLPSRHVIGAMSDARVWKSPSPPGNGDGDIGPW